jgi:type 1 glutamine amidotransferase
MVDKEKGGKTVKTRVATGKILEQGRMPNVWTKPWDKGRVVYISFCHDAKAARQPIVQQLLLQSVLWAGGAQ